MDLPRPPMVAPPPPATRAPGAPPAGPRAAFRPRDLRPGPSHRTADLWPGTAKVMPGGRG